MQNVLEPFGWKLLKGCYYRTLKFGRIEGLVLVLAGEGGTQHASNYRWAVRRDTDRDSSVLMTGTFAVPAEYHLTLAAEVAIKEAKHAWLQAAEVFE